MKIEKNIQNISITLPILAQKKYLQIKSDKYGWLMNENFILPYFLDTRLIFTRMVFTYGLLPLKEGLSIEDEQNFLDEMVNFVKKEKLCDFIYKAQSNVILNCCPKSSDCVEWGTYEVDLTKNEEELLKSFHGKHRNVIKKAMKDGVEVLPITDIKLAQEIIAKTMIRQKVIHYPSLEFLEKLQTNLNDNLLILSSKKENVIQGVAIIIYDKEKAYYMYGGSVNKPYTGSMNLLHFEAMKILKEKKVLKYDFVGARLNFKKGSKYEGLDRFKSRFGGTLIKGYAFRYVVNPIKFKLFNILSKTYLKLKGYEYVDPIDSIGKIK